MTNFESLKGECESYWSLHARSDQEWTLSQDSHQLSYTDMTWGSTEYQSFVEIILSVKKPRRFVVFGCSTGYQCFYWNHLFPDIPCVGVDLMEYRLQWGREKIQRYLISGVELLSSDYRDFEVLDGDLVWQNNLMFSQPQNSLFSLDLLERREIEMISYTSLREGQSIFEGGDLEFVDSRGEIKLIKNTTMLVQCSWHQQQSLVHYWRWKDNANYGVESIRPEFIIPEASLKNYTTMNWSKRLIKSEVLKGLYNKYNSKLIFLEFGFRVPELYHYTENQSNLVPILADLKTFVAKPAHFSESVDVFQKKSVDYPLDLESVNKQLNRRLSLSDCQNWRRASIGEEIFWKNCQKGIVIEEYISVVYELKVFVVFGEPIFADLRTGPTEAQTLDFIGRNNKYLDWDREYELIKSFAKSLEIDFFRIDFLYDGSKLYASELAFMPGTFLPPEWEEVLTNRLRMPYLRHYYPQLC